MELADRVRRAGKVLLIGNGGSSATAAHICNDLESCGIRAYVMNEATKSAWENDHGHENVFARWVNLHGDSIDLLIALSGSGKSENVLKAVAAAEARGMDVHREFGAAQGLDMQQAEEAQLRLGHDLMRALRANPR